MVFNRANINNCLHNEKIKNFHVRSNNKVCIAFESREVLLDPSLFPDHCPWLTLALRELYDTEKGFNATVTVLAGREGSVHAAN